MNYLCQYKNGATITVFAPYDCGNHCPFCVNKADYKADKTFDLDAVGEALFTLHDITPSCDIVLTGGEPFADLSKLKILVQAVALLNAQNAQVDIPKHKLFINTTLPGDIYKNAEFINKFSDIITGLNVSRHPRPDVVKECDDKIFTLIENVDVRINSVIQDKYDTLIYMTNVYDRYRHYECVKGFQVREDYTQVNAMNLYEYSPIMRDFMLSCAGIGDASLDTYFKTHLIFKNDFRWNLQVNEDISYHKTLPYSVIYCGATNKEINDIIITPQGRILDDWNHYGSDLDLDLYKKRILRPVAAVDKFVSKQYLKRR